MSPPCGAIIVELSDEDRFKLRCFMVERRLKGQKNFFFTTFKFEQPLDGRVLVTVTEALAEYPRTPLEFFDRALLNLSRIAQHPSTPIALGPRLEPMLFSFQKYTAMVEQLVDLGYLAGRQGTGGDYLITGKGWERITNLNTPGRDSKQAFVAMWFDDSRTKFFDDGFKPAIEEDGATRAFRIDRKEHNEKIDDEIVAEIRRSRYLVADFTGNRAGVYFEAGFALGLGLPVIWCVEQGHEGDLHFDTRQYNHITYTNPADLKIKLLNRILATIV